MSLEEIYKKGFPTLKISHPSTGLCLKLGLFGIVRVYNPNSWITIPMTRIVGKICKALRNYENNLRGAPRPGGARPKAAPLFLLFFLVFLHIWANILVFRMLALGTRMLDP